jgi:hypothetical protein
MFLASIRAALSAALGAALVARKLPRTRLKGDESGPRTARAAAPASALRFQRAKGASSARPRDVIAT